MSKLLGADVVGMTAMPEAALARELGIHYAGIAVSVNWAAGIRGALELDFGVLDAIRGKLLPLILDVLRTTDPRNCTCTELARDDVRSFFVDSDLVSELQAASVRPGGTPPPLSTPPTFHSRPLQLRNEVGRPPLRSTNHRDGHHAGVVRRTVVLLVRSLWSLRLRRDDCGKGPGRSPH